MNNPALSSHAEHDAGRWYREPWPWLLAAGPFIVVVASLTSAWIAVKTDDGVVAQDYYKQGLLINQRLKNAVPDRQRSLGAIITVGTGGDVRARVVGLASSPPSIRLKLVRALAGSAPQIVTLDRAADGDYVGVLQQGTPGRWIVTLETDEGPLPTTTVAGRLSDIRLGTADHS
jgi:uncharacterized protein